MPSFSRDHWTESHYVHLWRHSEGMLNAARHGSGGRTSPAGSGFGCEILSGLVGTLRCACGFELIGGFLQMSPGLLRGLP